MQRRQKNKVKTFEEYQTLAVKTPLALRNDRDRINLPVLGLQEETGKIGALLTRAFASGKLKLTQEQTIELRARLSDTLWYMALLCSETSIAMQDVATQSITRLEAKTKALDRDQR